MCGSTIFKPMDIGGIVIDTYYACAVEISADAHMHMSIVHMHA